MFVIDFLWDYIIPFLFVLTVLVFVHELGHYAVARFNRVRVEVFSIGFGPEIYGWTDRLGTRWKFGAVPLGGYVKMFGEHDFDNESSEDKDSEPMTPEDRAVSFHYKKLSQRFAIVAAGPIANFIFAFAILAAVFIVAGVPRPLAGVGSILPESAAEKSGFAVGDQILSIDGVKTLYFEDLHKIIRVSAGRSLKVLILRDKTELTLTAVPQIKTIEGDDGPLQIGLLGVTPDPEQLVYESLSVFESASLAIEKSYGLTTGILSAVGQLISGERDSKEIGGPIRIAEMSGNMAQGGFINLIFFMAALSINLGLINLFPIPMLDGGHLAFYAAEAVRGRPIGARIQEYGFRFGLALILLLMIFATWNDLVYLKEKIINL